MVQAGVGAYPNAPFPSAPQSTTNATSTNSVHTDSSGISMGLKISTSTQDPLQHQMKPEVGSSAGTPQAGSLVY